MTAGATRITSAFVAQRFCRNLVFHYAITVSFYLSAGLTVFELFVVNSVYWVARAVIDMPLGYLADNVGRRRALLAGTVVTAVAYFTMSQSVSFVWFAVANMLLAIGHSLSIGTDSALVRSALEDRARAMDYPRTESLGWLGRNVALAVSMSLGGFIAARTAFRTTIMISSVSVVPAIAFVLAIPASTAADRVSRARVRTGLTALRARGAEFVMRLLVYSVFVVNEFTGNLLIQLTLRAHEVAVDRLAFVFAAVLVVAAASSMLAPALSKIGSEACLWLMVAAISTYFALEFAGLSLRGTGGIALSVLGFVAYGIVRGVYHPIFRTWIGNSVDQGIRATAFAAASATGTLAVGAANPAFAWVIEHFGLAPLMLACAVSAPMFVGVTYLVARNLSDTWSIGGHKRLPDASVVA